MKHMKNKILALLISVLMIAALIPVGAFAEEQAPETEASVSFIGISGTAYTFTASEVEALAVNPAQTWKGEPIQAAYLKDLLAAKGAENDLGECSYNFAASDGYNVDLKAAWYDEFALFLDGEAIRPVLMDSTLVQGGWYSPSPLSLITAKNHYYENGVCTNPINISKKETAPCGAEQPAQPLSVSASAKSVGYADVKKAAQTFSLITVSGNEGELSYEKTNGDEELSIDAASGMVKMKKGTAAGTYKATVAVTAAETEKYLAVTESVEVTVKVTKADQPMKASAKAQKVKYSKSKQTITGAITVKNNEGKVTYAKKSGSRYLSIASKTGKITIAKKTPKGKYSIKVNVKAAGDDNYKAGTKTVTVKVTVK